MKTIFISLFNCGQTLEVHNWRGFWSLGSRRELYFAYIVVYYNILDIETDNDSAMSLLRNLS